MYVPEKNDSPQDFVRMLAPTHTYGEKDLDAHLVSTYAQGRRQAGVRGAVPRRAQEAEGRRMPTPATAPPDDDDDGRRRRDRRGLRDAVRQGPRRRASTRRRARSSSPAPAKLVAKVRGDEEKKLVAALAKIGVDWSAPGAGDRTPRTSTSRSRRRRPAQLKAGEDRQRHRDREEHRHRRGVPRAAAHRRPTTACSRTSSCRSARSRPARPRRSPRSSRSRRTRSIASIASALEVREARNAPRQVDAGARSRSRPRPARCSRTRYQLVDDGNGDGLVQRGEKYRLAGPGQEHRPGPDAGSDRAAAQRDRRRRHPRQVALRAQGRARRRARSRSSSSRSRPTRTLKADEVVARADGVRRDLDVQASDKLHFKVAPGVIGEPRARRCHGEGRRSRSTRARPMTPSVVGRRAKGASYSAIGDVRPVHEGQARRRRASASCRPRRSTAGGAGSRRVHAVLELDAAD